MISDKYKTVFVHIPKTGGQSIEHFFLNLHDLDWNSRDQLLLRENKLRKYGPERLSHLTAFEYKRYGYLSSNLYEKYFKFSFVRNPYSRLVSEYNYVSSSRHMTFKEFLKIGFSGTDSFSDQYRHMMPQYEFIYGRNKQLLVDFVGKFENLQSDFDRICLILKIRDKVLPHVNSSKKANNVKDKIKKIIFKPKTIHEHYTEYYDDELKGLVEKKYFRDLETFDYTFENG